MDPGEIGEEFFSQLELPQPSHGPVEDTTCDEFLPPIEYDDTFPLSAINFYPEDNVVEFSNISFDAQIPLPPPDQAEPLENPNSANFPPINYDSSQSPCSLMRVNPEPHISTQFYTFNKESHALMIKCLMEGRSATPEEIRAVTSRPMLASWRTVWRDRNEDTAYATAWKRIQDKLTVRVGNPGVALFGNDNHFICFKNNLSQFVPHFGQWQDIVMSFHSDSDCRHLGLTETIDRIKRAWTVGAKFYGIPESYIKNCLAVCPVCLNNSPSSMGRSKKRKFEFTESIDVPVKEVSNKLQQLALEHKAVLSIRQAYIRYKPFMAEVKDYTCHRAGEPPSLKSSSALKREPQTPKRCGCCFRIRTIIPISNRNENDKKFVYEEEGTAIFKIYPVHSGHEPGASDDEARTVLQQNVGFTEGALMDEIPVGSVGKEEGNSCLVLLSDSHNDLQRSLLEELQVLKNEATLLEGKIGKIPSHLLGSLSGTQFINNHNSGSSLDACSGKDVKTASYLQFEVV